MTINTLANWHRVVAGRNGQGLESLLAEDVVFHSPVVHAPQVGRAITTRYLTAAFRILANDSFRYVREVAGDRDAVLEFQVEIEDVIVNGVDMIKWDSDGRIIEFKVMLRPLKAINLVHQKMAAMLKAAE